MHLGQVSAIIQWSGEVIGLSEEGELHKWLSHPCCHAVSLELLLLRRSEEKGEDIVV